MQGQGQSYAFFLNRNGLFPFFYPKSHYCAFPYPNKWILWRKLAYRDCTVAQKKATCCEWQRIPLRWLLDTVALPFAI